MKLDKAKDGDSVEIWGDGTSRREFMDAYCLADAVFFCLENYDKLPNLINIGTGIDYTIKEYYETVADIIGRKCRFTFNTTRPTGMAGKLLNVEKIQRLGWKSRLSLTEGIRKAYGYYKEIHP